MSRRIVEVSGFDAHLTVKYGQVQIAKDGFVVGNFPAEDVDLLISDTRNSTFSNSTLVEMVQTGGLVVLCGPDHLPAALVVPVQGNHLMNQRTQLQIKASVPCKKKIWQELIRAKILNQSAAVMPHKSAKKLSSMADRVKSGDPENVEAQAARLYWSIFFSDQKFLRDKDGDGPNVFLNYGYMILRAMIARAIFAAGLNPAFGIHHCNRANGFCLADDMVEPFRPWVDRIARELYREGERELTTENKRRLLEVLYARCLNKGFSSTLQIAADKLAIGIWKRFDGETVDLPVPIMLHDGKNYPEDIAESEAFRV